MKCIFGENIMNPTIDSMMVHKNSYFDKTIKNKEKVCLNCKNWNKTDIAIGKCCKEVYISNGCTWYEHSCDSFCFKENIEKKEKVNMKIVDKLMVGGFEYEIIQSNKPILFNNSECIGLCDGDEQKIFIKNDLTNQRKEQTLIHEILHAIHMEYNYDLGDETEAIVDMFANGLYSVIKNNKDLF